jgi:bacterioferritin
MSTKQEVISHLNIILKNELTAINQYFLHAKMLQHMGYATFGAHEYQESIDEMKHADLIMQRIFMLGGLPNLQDIGRLRIGENPIEIIKADYEMEQEVYRDLIAAHKVCDDGSDPTSTTLIEEILASEEKHIEELEARLKQIAAMGEQNYLQTLI